VGIASRAISKPVAFRPDAPTGFRLSIAVAMDLDALALGIAMFQI
jgi:hypothetical protein